MTTNTNNETAISNSNPRAGKLSPRAALTCKYAGPTNRLGSRIIVTSQHALGRKTYAWDYALDVAENYVAAASAYLARIEEVAKGAYGEDATGWGGIEDYAYGVTHDGLHVFCSIK